MCVCVYIFIYIYGRQPPKGGRGGYDNKEEGGGIDVCGCVYIYIYIW